MHSTHKVHFSVALILSFSDYDIWTISSLRTIQKFGMRTNGQLLKIFSRTLMLQNVLAKYESIPIMCSFLDVQIWTIIGSLNLL